MCLRHRISRHTRGECQPSSWPLTMRTMCFKTKDGIFLVIFLGGSRLSEMGSIKTCHNISIVKVEDDGFSCFKNKPYTLTLERKKSDQFFAQLFRGGKVGAPNPIDKTFEDKIYRPLFLEITFQKLTGVSLGRLIDYPIFILLNSFVYSQEAYCG